MLSWPFCLTKKKHIGGKGLFNDQGVWRSHPNEIQQVVVSYFLSMFSTNGCFPCLDILHSTQSRVTLMMNDLLLAEYSDFEINEALFQMEPHIAPGSDGMPPIFFQKF